jgi:hypothetical protein
MMRRVALVIGKKGSFETPAGTVNDNPGNGETFSGSPVSDGDIQARYPPAPKNPGNSEIKVQ